jgi:hypothetical protein
MLSAKLLCAARADHPLACCRRSALHGSTHLWWRCVRLPAGQVLIPITDRTQGWSKGTAEQAERMWARIGAV